MKIIISNSVDLPIYEQIKEQIKVAILDGSAKEGDMLPSIRTLAKELKISVITTTRAYADLEAEGFIKSMQGKGSFVLPVNDFVLQESYLKSMEENILSAIENAKKAGIDKKAFYETIALMVKGENYE